MTDILYLLAFPSSTTAKAPPMINDAICMTKETELRYQHIGTVIFLLHGIYVWYDI